MGRDLNIKLILFFFFIKLILDGFLSRYNDIVGLKTNLYSSVIYVRYWEVMCHNVYACIHAQSLQSCLTFCDPMECSPPGASVHGISQARILDWVAISFSRGSSQLRDQTQVSYIACIVCGSFTHWATWEVHHNVYITLDFIVLMLGCTLQACKPCNCPARRPKKMPRDSDRDTNCLLDS